MFQPLFRTLSQALRARAATPVLLTACVGVLAACGQGGAPGAGGPPKPGPVPVQVLEAVPGKVPVSLEVVGQAEGVRRSEVRPRVTGVLVERAYAEGSTVRAGQVLFRIERAQYEIAVAQARAALAEQRARAEQAAREAARLQSLSEQNAVSRKEADDAHSADALAQAQVQKAEAALRQAELDLSYTVITAPVSGVSGRAALSEGSLVSPASTGVLTTIIQHDPLWVRFSLSDAEHAALGGARRLKPVRIEAVLADGAVFPAVGTLNYESGEVDARLGTVALRAEFANPDARVLPGQFVRVRLVSAERDGVFRVPQTAVLAGEKGRFVYVLDDGKAAVRPIKTAGWAGQDWVVTEGLKPGERIVLDNLLKLKPGADIKPAELPSAPAPAASPKQG